MTEATTESAIPDPVMGHYDRPMWDSIAARAMALQLCSACHDMRYPPGPVCPNCLSPDFTWKPLGGGATILSWVVFHRGYLPAYPPPYNCIAVRIDEGPVMISNLEGPQPEGSWIGRRVGLCYVEAARGRILPRFRLDEHDVPSTGIAAATGSSASMALVGETSGPSFAGHFTQGAPVR